MIRRAREVVVGSLLCATIVYGSASAMQFSSSDFLIDAATLNNVGGFNSSTNYQLTSSGGEAVIGNGASGSYMMPAGYVAQLPSMISVKTEPYGLIGYYPMDEGSGTATYDASTNANTGTLLGGPTWTTGKIGGALNFSGSTQGIDLGTSPSGLGSSTMTVEAWIKTSTVSSTPGMLFGDGLNNFAMILVNGKLMGGAGGTPASSSANIADGSWHQVAITVASGGACVLYIDGVQSATGFSSPSAVGGNTSIGGSVASGNAIYTFPGLIDQMKIFNRALSSQEIAAEYAAQNAGIETGLTLQTIIPGVSNSSAFSVYTQTTSGGYNLAINQDHNLQNGSNTLPAISGSIASPIAWNEGTTKGLGFTLTGTNATAIAGSWNSGAAYAALPNSATTFYTRTGLQSTKDYVNMQLRADAATSQPSGAYANTMTITGTTNP